MRIDELTSFDGEEFRLSLFRYDGKLSQTMLDLKRTQTIYRDNIVYKVDFFVKKWQEASLGILAVMKAIDR